MNQLTELLLEGGFLAAQLLREEPMSRHTTMRVGGPAQLLIMPRSAQQVCLALQAAGKLGIPAIVIGNGSNLIVRDGGVRGAVIALGESFSAIEAQDGHVLRAQAGARLAQIAAVALKKGLAGLEFASGIPGTVGGGVAMNAGAYGGEIKDVLARVTVLESGKLCAYDNAQMDFGYRTSRVLRAGGVILDAEFRLHPDNAEAIGERMNQMNARRRDKQPLNFPSAGSTFKRPEGYFAGALIEEAGLKGLRVGGAQVSEKHAGFVVNTGGATAGEVLALIERVQAEVKRASGVALVCEVRVIGEA
ncbi:MAG: UDP-N-acetylmuramate dehydrogenase [Clostridia bacterium]